MFYVYGGGEFLCLHTCKALQEADYRVSLVCDVFDPHEVERIYKMGKVLDACDHVEIPQFRPKLGRFLALQHMKYALAIRNLVKDTRANTVFSTQSSLFYIPSRRMYHFIYDIIDLFAYPPIHSPISFVRMSGPNRFLYATYYWFLRQARSAILKTNPSATHFFCLSEAVLRDLNHRGLWNASVIHPPCDLSFKPKNKLKRVVQVTRLVPQKRLEWFIKVAERLPQYDFLIVGRDPANLHHFNPGYSNGLKRGFPANLKYVESPIRQRPDLLEESAVYLYTGVEAGVGIALMEAAGAGCIPITPREGGGAEVINALKLGYQFDTIDEAVETVRTALEHSSWTPEEVSRQAEIFSSDVFEERIRRLVE